MTNSSNVLTNAAKTIAVPRVLYHNKLDYLFQVSLGINAFHTFVANSTIAKISQNDTELHIYQG